MIKKKLMILASCSLAMGLAACNNNNDHAFDNGNNNNGTLNVGNNDTDNRNDGRFLPFTDEFNARENDDRSNNFGFRRNRNNEDDDLELNYDYRNISSMNTSLSSDKYPHTRAKVIQEAKYQFIQISPKQGAQQQTRIRQHAQAPAPQQQAGQQQAPDQQQQTQQTPEQQGKAQEQTKNNNEAPQSVSQAAQQVIELTNAQRRKNGLPDLQADSQLNGVAQKKSTDMQQNNYFSHTSPTYGSPFDMMRDFGVSYKTAGENIAQGQQTPEQVVQSWMNSEGHRKNILSREFTHIGVGYDQNGHHWTQMFIGK